MAMSGTQSQDLQPADTPPLSTKVLEAVARAEGTTPLDLEYSLYHAIDPDALDTLFEADTSGMSVTFTYHGYRVTVQGDGDVAVRTPAD